MSKSMPNLGLDRFSGVYLGIAFIILFSFASPLFLTASTFHLLASSQAVSGMIAIAVLIPMVCGQFDLSVGANANFTGLVAVVLLNHGWGFSLALVASVSLGLLVGFFNGLIVVRLKVSSFIATLGASSVLVALSVIVTNSIVPPPPASQGWAKMTQFEVGGFQIIILYLVVLALLVWWMLEWTPAGRYLRAIGGNAEAARLSGVRVDRWAWISLVLSGGISGLGGVLYTSLTGPSFTFGATLLLPAFAAVFLGSTQLQPGRFNVWGTLIAIFVLAIGVQGLQLLSSVLWLSAMFNGVALIAAVALAVNRTSRTGPRPSRLRPDRSGEGAVTSAASGVADEERTEESSVE
jgi:ribose transport system permease protein